MENMKNNFWVFALLLTVLFSGLNLEAKRGRGRHGRRHRFGFGINVGSPYYRYGSYNPYRYRTVVVRDDSDSNLRDALNEYKDIVKEQKNTIEKLEDRLEGAEEEIRRLQSK